MAHGTGICQTRMRDFLPVGIALFIPAVVANVQIVFGAFFFKYAPSRIVFGVIAVR